MDIKIAIVEDEEAAAKKLYKMITAYKQEKRLNVEIDAYSNGRQFVNCYRSQYDVVFLDIEMPKLGGMDAAKEIRKTDEEVLIVFVTNMAQYAVASYDVRAYDYILKPVTYAAFSMKFDKVVNELKHRLGEDSYLTLNNRSGARRVRVSDIRYLEVKNHDLIFHFSSETFSMRGTMDEFEKRLEGKYFSRCNACFLVNLEYVRGFNGEYVDVDGEELKISRTRRKDFLNEFAMYAGGSK